MSGPGMEPADDPAAQDRAEARRRWLWATGLLAAFALLLAFMTRDEPPRAPRPKLEEIVPSFPGAAKSHRVLMRLVGVNAQALGLGNRSMWQGSAPNQSPSPEDPVKFRNFLLARAADVEADWNDLGPVRAWWNELAAFDRLGDTGSGLPSDPSLPFTPIRAYYQLAAAIAGLEALDGNGDAAFAILQPALEVARKLEPSSRSLMRSMIARTAQRELMAAANFVLDTTAVSPEARARLAAALALGNSGAAGIRQMLAVETTAVARFLGDPQATLTNWGEFFPPNSWQSSLALTAGPVL